MKESMKKFTFFIVAEFEAFSRDDTEERYPLAGILGIHSLTVHHEGILAQKLFSMDCKPSGLCPGCTEVQLSLAINLSASEEHKHLQMLIKSKIRKMMGLLTSQALMMMKIKRKANLHQGMLSGPNMV